MKTHLYTFFIRWYSAQGKPLPRWVESACEKNADLHRERTLEDELSRQLKVSPEARQAHSDVAELSAQVLAALREEVGTPSPDSMPQSAPTLNWRIVAFPLAAAAAIALLITFSHPRLGEDPAIIDGGITVAAVSNLPDFEIIDVETSPWKNPLDQEVENVLTDAKGAMGFLASSFLPSSLAGKLVKTDGDAS